MTGCGLPEADLVRRALSAPDGPERTAVWFRSRAAERGYDPQTVERVWQVVAAFGGFGFCKAHAAAFAIPVYQSAWLKRHHPAAFYAGVLTHDPGMYPKRVIIGDARLSGIEVLPLDINASAADWKVENSKASSYRTPRANSGAIRVCFREVKGISDAEVTRIVRGQPYESLRDFWDRARVSRPTAERLVLAGAFDALYSPLASGAPGTRRIPSSLGARSSHLAPQSIAAGARLRLGGDPLAAPGPAVTRRDLLARVGVLDQGTTRSGAPQLFSAGDGLEDVVPAGQLRELDPAERVAAELEILGFDVSRHVLDFYAELLDGLRVVRSRDLDGCRAGDSILVAGVKVATQTPAVRSGQRVIFATLDDAVGLVDLAFFESVQERCAARLFGSWLLVVRGKVRRAGAGPTAVSLNATECWDIPALDEIRQAHGMEAVRKAMASGSEPAGAPRQAIRPAVFANGFALSPYAETGTPGASLKTLASGVAFPPGMAGLPPPIPPGPWHGGAALPLSMAGLPPPIPPGPHPPWPRTLWHASPGSSAQPEVF
jgi:error-prone DNA polymerase